jgi:hypothetical protein
MSCPRRALVDRHFALDSRPEEEADLRAHLDSCPTCRAYYDRHLLLARLDPAAPRVEERIAAGLGLRARPARWPLPLGLAAVSAAALVLVMARGRSPADSEFGVRGGPGAAPGPALQIFCTSCGHPPVRVIDRVPASATLAFSYQNPAGKKHLMVLAVDDRRQIYWYHPDPVANPLSVKIDQTVEERELTEEIVQTFAGSKLVILALFSDESLSAAKVESLVEPGGCASLRALGAVCLERRVKVER